MMRHTEAATGGILKKGVLCRGLFFKKIEGLEPATLLKRRPWQRCFPVNFEKFLRTLFLQNTFGGLRLDINS